MTSIVSKLARAAVATHASSAPIGCTAGGSRSTARCLPGLWLTGGTIRRMCRGVSPAGGPNSEEEKGRPNSEDAVDAAAIDPIDYLHVQEDFLKSKEALWAL
ncbi:hypothetical protein VPH35_036450 [Triticum aestivum]